MKFKTLFLILLTVFITIILMQNADEVKFKVLVWDLYLPKLVILTGAIFLGVIVGLMLANWPKRITDDPNSNNNQSPNDTLSQEDRDYISE
ncbi:MAG: hypothetical protein ACRYFB_09760 [Janthinobacterium lividum]